MAQLLFFCNNQGPEFPGSLVKNFSAGFVQQNGSSSNNNNNNLKNDEASAARCPTPAQNSEVQESKKRIAMDISESSSAVFNPSVSKTGIKRKNSLGRGKRVKVSSEEEDEKPKDVVHVRARRGQATDSHSLAERVRRGKINERMKCLQDIVPGCSKVEFLSMKLTAARSFQDFNSETEDVVGTKAISSSRISRSSEDDDREKEEGFGSRISSALMIMEDGIRTFMDFLKADKEKPCQKISAMFKRKRREEDEDQRPSPFAQMLEKKNLKVEEMEILLGLIDLKLVSRVLRMSDLSAEQLHWCEEKMSKVRVLDGKYQRDSTPLFFPAQ
ncbi:hypothetical protein OROHE_019769 [Orobanche hederae]